MAQIRGLRSVSSALVAGLLLGSCYSARIDPNEFDQYYSNATDDTGPVESGYTPARYQPEPLAADPNPALTPRSEIDVPPPVLEPESATVVRLQKGDNLYQIAQRHLGSARRWREIAQLNGLSEAQVHRLPVGQEIKLPAR